MNNPNISLENQDIISDIDDLLPKLKILQQEYEEDEHQKKLEDEAWKKRYDKAKAEFNKRSENMLGMVKPIMDVNSFKHVGMLYLGIFFLLWVISPFSELADFFSPLFTYGIGAFFILCVIYFPLSSKIYDNTEQRKERTRKELEEIKKREYPILFEREPSYYYWEKQYNYTKALYTALKERYPQLGDIVNEYCSRFSETISQLKEVRYLLNSGQAQTYEDATRMMRDTFIEKYEQQIAESKEYFAEKERMQRESREYQEERRRKEEAEYQRKREENARRDAEETAWLKEQELKRQQALIDEERMNIAGMATHARQNGKDRATVRMYDDMLGRSYHERLDEDRTYEYGKEDKASDIGGGGL
ncbi:hypothetical protein [Bacillus luti]|uniref:Uncharacterized protein n=1 Tax=Bacillus luti TaxID=2026191 RepID=A0A7V7V4C6_9BACI|nr:hypothetical protein [Bacillus luti]KAB2442178.1 hypothetical protein F8163_16255 [Bacillus luti]